MLYRHSYVSQFKLLMFAVFAAAFSPIISSQTGLSLAVIFSIVMCILIWSQEVFIIQFGEYSKDNIEFTQRFRDRYNGMTALFLGLIPHFLSLVIIVYILLNMGGWPSTNGWLILMFLGLTLVRIFDPLLGCISTIEPISWSSIIGYIVIFSFATSTAIDPQKLDFYPFPAIIMHSILLSVIIFTILNLRMAYYQRYCFLQEQSLEMQLKLVLIPLLILSIHQVLTIVDTVDFSSILNK
jgi:hypothetical protein